MLSVLTLSIRILSVLMLSVLKLNVDMMNVVMMNVLMLNVIIPSFLFSNFYSERHKAGCQICRVSWCQNLVFVTLSSGLVSYNRGVLG